MRCAIPSRSERSASSSGVSSLAVWWDGLGAGADEVVLVEVADEEVAVIVDGSAEVSVGVVEVSVGVVAVGVVGDDGSGSDDDDGSDANAVEIAVGINSGVGGEERNAGSE